MKWHAVCLTPCSFTDTMIPRPVLLRLASLCTSRDRCLAFGSTESAVIAVTAQTYPPTSPVDDVMHPHFTAPVVTRCFTVQQFYWLFSPFSCQTKSCKYITLSHIQNNISVTNTKVDHVRQTEWWKRVSVVWKQKQILDHVKEHFFQNYCLKKSLNKAMLNAITLNRKQFCNIFEIIVSLQK